MENSFKKWLTWPVILIIVLALVLLYGLAKYNGLVKANIAVSTPVARM